MSTRLLIGDCRVTLAALPERSVASVITSPPYYGLREYGTPPLVWGGDPEHAHEWESVHRLQRSGVNHDGGAGYREREDRKYIVRSDLCSCGAWLGSLGLEPTPELWIEHLVEVFRAVRRVLADTGTVWLNLGDSYAGSGKGPSGYNGITDQARRQGFINDKQSTSLGSRKNNPVTGGVPPAGYKAKDLMMLPARLAIALQADGWYLRSMIPWLKRNSMPESVTDRPATACEYVFLLSKQARYFWDADAVRVAQSANTVNQNNYEVRAKSTNKFAGGTAGARVKSGEWEPGSSYGKTAASFHQDGRNLRNSDFFFQTWQGLELDEQDAPLALVVNPTGYKGAHYAVFPTKLVEPMIKASTSEKGQCPECGAPWIRVVDREPHHGGAPGGRQHRLTQYGGRESSTLATVANYDTTTTGWRPTCTCCTICNGRHPDAAQGSGARESLAQGVEQASARVGSVSGERIETAQTTPEDVRTVQPAVQGTGRDGAVLQSDLLSEVDVGHRPGEPPQAGWVGQIPLDQQAGASDGRPRGQDSDTSLVDGRTPGPFLGTVGTRPSHQRDQGRQPDREPCGAAPARTHAAPPDEATHQLTPFEPVPQTILDPFGGSGTCGVVADRLGRNAILCELSPSYGDQAVDRVTNDAPMFASIEVA